jgi:hypothetical protein
MSSAASHLTIIPDFGTDVPADQLADYQGAVDAAIQALDSVIATPMTLHITFDLSTSGSLGESETDVYDVSYASLRRALARADTHSAVQEAALRALPATDPTGGSGLFAVTAAQADALGLNVGAGNGDVGTVTLNTSDGIGWSPSSLGGGRYDAVGIIEHEITEVMGRIDLDGDTLGGSSPYYSVLDLYRYTAANGSSNDAPGAAAGVIDQPFTAGYSAGAQSYFSYNGSTITLPYDSPAEVAGGDDVADWSSTVSDDAFDGIASPGQVVMLSSTDLQEMSVIGYDVVCFLEGTRIAVPGGEIEVERLCPGDLVWTDSGVARPVRWLGVQTVSLRFADPARVLPIRIPTGALGPGLPRRDLLVSPGHALLLDGLLVQAGALAGSGAIRRETRMPARFRYFHVELDSHDLLIAEGVPAESFLDAAAELPFDNAAGRGERQLAESLPYPRIKAPRQLPAALPRRLAMAQGAAAA